jgi:hypothetical protein
MFYFLKTYSPADQQVVAEFSFLVLIDFCESAQIFLLRIDFLEKVEKNHWSVLCLFKFKKMINSSISLILSAFLAISMVSASYSGPFLFWGVDHLDDGKIPTLQGKAFSEIFVPKTNRYIFQPLTTRYFETFTLELLQSQFSFAMRQLN